MDLFNIFGAETTQTAPKKFSPWNSRPENDVLRPLMASNPDAQKGGSNRPILNSGNTIQQYYNRLGLWFSGFVAPHMSPTIESSLYWPLRIQMDFVVKAVAAPGDALPVMFAPPGIHRIILSYLFSLSGLVAQPLTNRINFRYQSSGGKTVLISSNCPLNNDLTIFIPFIGGSVSQHSTAPGSEPDNVHVLYGRKPLYISSEIGLVVDFDVTGAGGSAGAEFSFIDLPENQPFGNLAGII